VRYICSNARSAEAFVKAWIAFQSSFGFALRDQHAAVGAEPEGERNAFDRWKETFARFSAAQSKFLSSVAAIAQQSTNESACSKSLSDDDVDGYMRTVAEMIAVAKEMEGQSGFVARSARERFTSAIHTIETIRREFEDSISEKRIDGDRLTSFLNAVNAFVSAETDFLTNRTTALERKTRQLGIRRQ
jgi:hypothetical protein